MKNLKKGFTLIELLVVIAIIGILATTLAPKLREQLAKAKDTKAIALLGAARTAGQVALVESMIADTNSGKVLLSDVRKKLDRNANELLTADTATIAVGGMRDKVGGTLTYTSTVTLGTTTSAGSITLLAKDDGTISSNGDDLNLVIAHEIEGTSASTEDKLWIKY